jgi:MFS family permease
VSRVRLPPFLVDALADVTRDRNALLGLVAACIALAAAGLDPHVLDPGQARMRAALGETPSLEMALTIAGLVQAAFLLLGGAVADIWRSRRILVVALLGLVVASAGATLMPDGPGLVASRVLAWACDGLIIPFAVGVVAQLYRGEARATALGILFGVFGAAGMIGPALVGVFGPHGPEVQAFALCAAAAVLGVWATRRWLPDLPGALPSQHLLIATTALWAFGVVAAADGLAQVEPALVVLGFIFIAAGLGVRRVARRPPEEGVRVRQAGAALAAGLVIGFSQTVPMIALPAFFTVVQGIDGFLSNFLLIPFVVAVLVAGPACGWLLERHSPRALIIGGTFAIAAGDLAFYAVLAPDTPYLALVVPFFLVGAGFVVATAIRTAVIFASTPVRLPATAAALNEASMGVGARLGATLVVLARTGALGDVPEVRALQLTLMVAALIGVVGGVVIFALLGRDDPVRTVWDLRDERVVPG